MLTDHQIIEAIIGSVDALRHYARHEAGCPHAGLREATGGHWVHLAAGLPPARIVHECTCGLSDVLRGIDAVVWELEIG